MGTGESCIRANLGQGDGVYKTTDGGRTWANVGLRESCQIGAVRVHPKDPDVVYVAALGNAFGPNEQRGVFRSTDGGDTWERVLFVSENAGAVDISMDPGNPARALRLRLAGAPGAVDAVERRPGQRAVQVDGRRGHLGGAERQRGPAGGADGQDRRRRLPCPSQTASGRSSKAGRAACFAATTPARPGSRINDNHDLGMRPWYYSHVFADPRDADTVYVFNVKAWKSTDGGQTFSHVTMPHTDTHDLWIDPRDSSRMVAGNDGGGCVTFNGGETWSTVFNQPTGQYYYMAADDQFPYRVYGTQQDGTAVSVASSVVHGRDHRR